MITDLDQACRFIGERIQQFPQDSENRLMWMEQFEGAVEVIATDDKSSDSDFLKIYLFPSHKPIIEFFSQSHREDSEELYNRFYNEISNDFVLELLETYEKDTKLQSP